MNNGSNVNNSRLLEQIRELSFVKAELELFLDTHPDSLQALDYYHKTVDALKKLIETYSNTRGPITAADVVDTDVWTWVDTPWPWQHGNGREEEA